MSGSSPNSTTQAAGTRSNSSTHYWAYKAGRQFSWLVELNLAIEHRVIEPTQYELRFQSDPNSAYAYLHIGILADINDYSGVWV